MTRSSRSTAVGVAVALVVGVSVALGLWFAGSPVTERGRRLDQRRLEDLRRIADGLDLYWTRQGRLPPSLDVLAGAGDDLISLEDPATTERYAYRILSTTAFELCARFDTEATPSDRREFWQHSAGRHCFETDAESVQRHPPELLVPPAVPEPVRPTRIR